METSLRIVFHQLPKSAALEADIRQRVDELEAVCDRIVSCRISVEAPHHHHQQGLLYRVCVDVGVPGHHVVVGGTPDHDHAHEDPYVAVRDAFLATKRRLEEHVRRSREHLHAET